jgi:hypothetical protein
MSMYYCQILITHLYVPPLKVYLMIQIMIPVILRMVCLDQYPSQCPVHHNKEVQRIPRCIRICIMKMMQCKFQE